jgi:hypothetical protein
VLQDLGATEAGRAALEHLLEHLKQGGIGRKSANNPQAALERIWKQFAPRCMQGDMHAEGLLQGFESEDGKQLYMTVDKRDGGSEEAEAAHISSKRKFAVHATVHWEHPFAEGQIVLADGTSGATSRTRMRLMQQCPIMHDLVDAACSTEDDWIWETLCAESPEVCSSL